MNRIVKKHTTKLIMYVLALLGFTLLFSFLIEKDDDYMKVFFFNAGKADAMVIFNKDFSVLIDTGEVEMGDTIIKYLNNNGIYKLDYLILTHFDKDHIGSASFIIDNIKIDKIVTSNYPKDSVYYKNFMDSVNKKSLGTIILRENLSFNFGDAKFVINAPLEEEYDNKPSNNSSLIVSLDYKNHKFLFMGDAMDARIKEYLSDYNDTVDVLKVPYHGRMLDSTEELISTIKPKYSIITSSIDDQADSEVLSILSKYNSNYYLTRKGRILITCSGDNIEINQYE